MKKYTVPIHTPYLLVEVILHCSNGQCRPRERARTGSIHNYGPVQTVEITVVGGYHSEKETIYWEWRDELYDSSLIGRSILDKISAEKEDRDSLYIFALPENNKNADYIVVRKNKVKVIGDDAVYIDLVLAK